MDRFASFVKFNRYKA